MKWLDLDWDEGPFRQTDRFDLYRSYVAKLGKKARHITATVPPKNLRRDARRRLQRAGPPSMTAGAGNLREPSPGRTPAVRFRMPQEGHTVVDDMIRGKVEFENSQLDDLIILRSDGTPTYNFTVVVDDVDMKITHVIGGTTISITRRGRCSSTAPSGIQCRSSRTCR